jgi:hypothetical protein
MARVQVQAIKNTQEVTFSDGKKANKTFFLGQIDNGAIEEIQTFAKLDVGQTYDGEIVIGEFKGNQFKTFKKAKTEGGFGGRGRTNPEERASIERQTALIQAVQIGVAVISSGKEMSADKVLAVADKFFTWISNKSEISNLPPFDDVPTITVEDVPPDFKEEIPINF